jgi:hypothetical protein
LTITGAASRIGVPAGQRNACQYISQSLYYGHAANIRSFDQNDTDVLHRVMKKHPGSNIQALRLGPLLDTNPFCK